MSKLISLVLLLLGVVNATFALAADRSFATQPREALTDMRYQLLPAELDVAKLVSDPDVFHAFKPIPANLNTLRVNHEQALWLKLTLNNPGQTVWQPVLLYSFLAADRVGFYRLHPELPSATLLSNSGSTLPFSERALPLLRFNQPLEVLAGETLTLLLRLQDAALLSTQLHLVTLEQAILDEQTRLLQDSLLSGVLVLLSCSAWLCYRLPGYRAFIWIGGFYASYLLILATLNGQAFRFIWPSYPELNPAILYVVVGINLFMLSVFCRKSLQLQLHRYHRILNTLSCWLAILLLFSPLFASGPVKLHLLFITVSLCLTINIVQAIWITLTTEQENSLLYTFLCTLAALCLLLLQIQHLTRDTIWFTVCIGSALLLMALITQQIIAQRQHQLTS